MFAREPLNPTTDPEENPSNFAQNTSLCGHLCRFGFSEEEPSQALHLENPKVPRGTGDYSQYLVDVKRKPLHIVFYSDSGPNQKSQQGGQFRVPIVAMGDSLRSERQSAISPGSKLESSVRTVVPLPDAFNAHSRCSNVDGCGLCGKAGDN